MPNFRVCVEETTVRYVYLEVEAEDRQSACSKGEEIVANWDGNRMDDECEYGDFDRASRVVDPDRKEYDEPFVDCTKEGEDAEDTESPPG